MTLRIGWFSTGRGEGSRALLRDTVAAIRGGELEAEIAFVFCNRERGEYEATDGFLDLVASHDIPTITLSSRRFRRSRDGERSEPGRPLPPWREEYDREVARFVEPYAFDIGVLAGYMLIFTEPMSRRFPCLNLHPAEPGGPVGTWQEVIWQLIDQRAERSGVMVHLATEELDRGPPVAYCTFSLRGPDFDSLWDELGARTAADVQRHEGEGNALFREIRRHGAARERRLVIEALRAIAAGRLRIEDRRVLDASGQPLQRGLDLTAEVDAAATRRLA